MALIKCPECGKEVSDRSEACIHCGYPMDSKETIVSTDETYEAHEEATKSSVCQTDVMKPIKVFKSKKIIIAVIAAIVLIILISSILIIASNRLSSEEEYGLKMVDKYQDMLKNPDSLVLRSDIAVISYSRDGEIYKYVFFDASGENSYGATVTSTPCFVNGQYLCDSDEIPSASEYMSMSDEEAKMYLGLQLALAHWSMYGEDAAEKKEDVVDSYSICAETIAKKLGISCKVD